MVYTVGSERGGWWTCALCSDAKLKFIFFGGGYINQLLLFDLFVY